jgi:RHS repeat-associated protein
MLVPNKHGASDNYRFGFQGQEMDNELKGDGNSYDFGERLLDPRVGRWASTDNVEKPWLSPYQFAANNPINNVDPDGNDEIHFYYKTQQMLGSDGKAYTQLTLSSEIIKNNSEHTFFMHSSQGAVTEFHPFKSDRTPNTGSRSAYDTKLPLSKGTSWFFGIGEKGVDDHAFFGELLQAAPEIMEHYSDIKKDGMRFQGAVDMAGSVDFAEKVISAEETVYALVDGYYLVKGLSKFAVKELAKNSLKIARPSLEATEATLKLSRLEALPKQLQTRPKWWKSTIEHLDENTPKDANGNFIDVNTGTPITGKKHIGHIKVTWRQYQDNPENWLKTREQVIKDYNDITNLRYESASSNSSHGAKTKGL